MIVLLPDILTQPQRIWLILLVAGWGALLFGGFLLGPTRHNRRIPRPARLTSSLLLVLAGWTWWFYAIDAWAQTYALRIALGMTLGFIGDLFLADLLISGKRAVIGGMTAFAAGHLCYLAAILRLLARTGRVPSTLLWLTLLISWGLTLAGWYFILFRGDEDVGLLHWAALPYALLLATTAGLAAGVAQKQPNFLTLAAGALLFLISDLILAQALFKGGEFPLHHDIVWLTYGPGQMLIVFSIGAAMIG